MTQPEPVATLKSPIAVRERSRIIASTVAFCATHRTTEVPAVAELIETERAHARADIVLAAKHLMAACRAIRESEAGTEPWDELCDAEAKLSKLLE